MGTCEGRVGCCVWLAQSAEMAAIELYTPQGAEMVSNSGMIYDKLDEQG